jgi:hypothetical protein
VTATHVGLAGLQVVASHLAREDAIDQFLTHPAERLAALRVQVEIEIEVARDVFAGAGTHRSVVGAARE